MNPPSESAASISSELLQGLRDDSPDSWRRLTELWRPILHRWCLPRGVPSQDADDVVQTALEAAARTIGNFRRDRGSGSIAAWLATIVRTKVCDYFEEQVRSPEAVGGSDFQKRLEELSAPSDCSGSTPAAELRVLLLRRVMDLVRPEFQESTWLAFWRSVVEQHDTADIARDLGVTPETVRQHKSRVLRRLRQAVNDVDESQA